MTARFMGEWLDGSPEWHKLREGRIGGSDVGAIIGHGYITREELLAEKRGEVAPRPQTPAMSRGHWLEPAGINYLTDHKGIEIDYTKHGTYVDDWRIYNPDGITTDGRLVEIKAPRTREGWGRGGTDQVPAGYLAQVTWGMRLLDLTECIFGVVATKITDRGPDFDFASYRVRYDAAFSSWLEARAHEFYIEMTNQQGETAA